MENKKYLNFLLLILIALGFVFFISVKKSQAPTVNMGSTETAIVASTTPTTEEIKSGTSKPNTNTKTAATKDEVYTVRYENSGFKPDTLEVKRGTSIRFVNNSTKSMRVESTDTTNNPILQAFSEPKTVGKGGVFEYTFNDTGTYYYANQFNSAARGTIVVK